MKPLHWAPRPLVRLGKVFDDRDPARVQSPSRTSRGDGSLSALASEDRWGGSQHEVDNQNGDEAALGIRRAARVAARGNAREGLM
jgi:hypothetical protein